MFSLHFVVDFCDRICLGFFEFVPYLELKLDLPLYFYNCYSLLLHAIESQKIM